MALIGVSDNKVKAAIADARNAAGGSAYTIDNPSVKLLHIVGSPGFNEPRQAYDLPTNPTLARKFKGNADGLTGPAKEILNAAIDVARSKNPRDLLAIAAWLRSEGNLRQTPLILLAVAASEPATCVFVRSYAPRIIKRADELAGAYGAYRYLFGKPIPAALLKGIKDAFKNFNEYQLVKYNKAQTPSLKDVLLQIPSRSPGNPVSRGVAEYLLNGKLVDKNGVDHSDTAPFISKHLKFLELAKESNGVFTTAVRHAAWEANIPWELQVSMFGSTKEVWEQASVSMGYMALLRNVRNLLEVDADVTEVCKTLCDPEEVKKSKQLPFRYLSAIRELKSASVPNANKKADVLNAISAALDIAASTQQVDGTTIIFVDVSGSMATKISSMSTVSMVEGACALAGIIAKSSKNAHVIAFADKAQLIDVRKNDSVETIIDKIRAANVGGGTYAVAAMELANSNNLQADRIIMLSDMQCYHGAAGNLQKSLENYKKHINRNVFVHSINMNGHDATSQFAEDARVNLVSGFSEKILGMLIAVEQGGSLAPSLDYIRSKF